MSQWVSWVIRGPLESRCRLAQTTREEAPMALARVVMFDGVSTDRMNEMRSQMEGGEQPEGMNAKEIVVLHDPEAERSMVVLFFDSEEGYRRGGEVLDGVHSGDKR